MVTHQRVIVTSLPLSKAYEVTLLYFKSLGFSEVEYIPNTYIKFERGSFWWGYNWQTKKIYAIVRFSQTQDKRVVILCSYEIPIISYFGKGDLKKADNEIYNFKNYIAQIEGNTQHRKSKRICPNCKREIPWDVTVCPYCKYDFSGVKKNKNVKNDAKKNVKKNIEDKNHKKCPKCKHRVPIDALFCPYCGYKFNDIVSENPSIIHRYPTQPDYLPYFRLIGNKELARKYAKYGVILGILGILIFAPLGILAIYYGYKARKIDRSKGMGCIILGIAALVIGIIIGIIILSWLLHSYGYYY